MLQLHLPTGPKTEPFKRKNNAPPLLAAAHGEAFRGAGPKGDTFKQFGLVGF